MTKRLPLISAILFSAIASTAMAADPVQVGIITPYSGPSGDAGVEMDLGIKVYQQFNGTAVKGREIKIIRKDAPSPAPDVARRLAQELVVRDKVDFLTGFIFTPTAISALQISTEAKVPLVIMNAATTGILAKAPYGTRASYTIAQGAAPLGTWAAKEGMKKAYTVVSDYAPGIEGETTFAKEFTAAGGTIIGSVRSPLDSVDFSAFARRIKDAQPDAIFAFLPTANVPKAFVRALRDAGLPASVKLLFDGSSTVPDMLDGLGDDGIGIISAQHYSDDHQSPLNQKFVKAYMEASGGRRPSYIGVGAFDAMHMIYKAVEAQGDKLNPDKTMEVFKGMKFESPRGPIEIDAATRDIVQNIYIRRVERKNNVLVNVEFVTIPAVKDPGAQ